MGKLLILAAYFVAFAMLLFSPTMVDAKSSTKPTLSAGVAKNRRSISVNFGNLSNTKKIKYQLTYNSTKGRQGVAGTLSPSSKSLSRQLLLGTCSHGVCVYHQGVKNIVLNVDFTLKSGGIISYSKRL